MSRSHLHSYILVQHLVCVQVTLTLIHTCTATPSVLVTLTLTRTCAAGGLGSGPIYTNSLLYSRKLMCPCPNYTNAYLYSGVLVSWSYLHEYILLQQEACVQVSLTLMHICTAWSLCPGPTYTNTYLYSKDLMSRSHLH